MCSIRCKFLLSVFLSVPLCYAVTVNDVQKLTANNFFGEWSKFLDQILKEQKEHISPENTKIYQAFIEQAKTLDMAKVTGNNKSISGMQEQMEGVQKRIGDEKKVAQDWKQLSEAITNAAQPISAEHEKQYAAFIKQAKALGIEKAQLDAMEAKMNELRGKLGVVPSQSTIPAPVMAPETLVRKEESKEVAPVHREEHEPLRHEEPVPALVREEKKEEKPAS